MIATSTRAGDKARASALSLPAATTVGTPAKLTRLETAVSTVGELPVVKLKEATPGLPLCLLETHSIPSMTSDLVPEPVSLKTLTETTRAALATPLCRSQRCVRNKKIPARTRGQRWQFRQYGFRDRTHHEARNLISRSLERTNMDDHPRYSYLYDPSTRIS